MRRCDGRVEVRGGSHVAQFGRADFACLDPGRHRCIEKSSEPGGTLLLAAPSIECEFTRRERCLPLDAARARSTWWRSTW